MFTGIDSGHIDLSVDVLDDEPGPADQQAWDEIVEATWTATGDGFTLGGPLAVEDVELIPLPAGSGQTRTSRVRVCARGRDQGRDAGYIDAARALLAAEDALGLAHAVRGRS